MNNLVVNSKFTTLITNDENPDTAAAVVERVRETVQQAALVKDREALLDITSLGHGNDASVLADV